jgi:hypothetical protein
MAETFHGMEKSLAGESNTPKWNMNINILYEKYGGKVCTVFMWLRTETSGSNVNMVMSLWVS